jgi:hypothetical protein
MIGNPFFVEGDWCLRLGRAIEAGEASNESTPNNQDFMI